jgi:NAD(P)-dependent dehydrogenase (short-subunit alcohol dehydrogenase family)
MIFKSVVITGASQGLGRALALDFSKNGARVFLIARSPEPLDRLIEEIRRAGGVAFGYVGDIANKNDIYPIAAQAAELIGPVDLLINNASTLGSVPLPLLLDTDCEDLSRTLETNLIGPFRLTKAFAGAMLIRGQGTILNISSDAAVSAYSNWGAYGTSKAALDHLTRIWAEELAETGVRFLSIDPGEMDTKMHLDALPESDRSTLKTPSHVASEIIAFLSRIEKVRSGSRLIASEWIQPLEEQQKTGRGQS